MNHYLLQGSLFSLFYFFPLFLLAYIQWRFADYHDLPTTTWHFLCFVFDLFLLTFYWNRITDPALEEEKFENWKVLLKYHWKRGEGVSAIWKLFLFVLFLFPGLVVLSSFFPNLATYLVPVSRSYLPQLTSFRRDFFISLVYFLPF